jgi:hypothetical protein
MESLGVFGGLFELSKLLTEVLNRQQRAEDYNSYQSRSAYLLAGQSEVIMGNVSHSDSSQGRQANADNDKQHSINGRFHPANMRRGPPFFQPVRLPNRTDHH